jgi:gliding motility-associated-like protein
MRRFSTALAIFVYVQLAYPQPVGAKNTTDTCRIPTIFTPNGDGENDIWEIPCLPADKTLNKSELWLFSEWGEQLGYHKPYLNDWNGNYYTKPLPDGTYFYIFRFSPDSPVQRGYITLFR